MACTASCATSKPAWLQAAFATAVSYADGNPLSEFTAARLAAVHWAERSAAPKVKAGT